jgi:hypothetical protein
MSQKCLADFETTQQLGPEHRPKNHQSSNIDKDRAQFSEKTRLPSVNHSSLEILPITQTNSLANLESMVKPNTKAATGKTTKPLFNYSKSVNVSQSSVNFDMDYQSEEIRVPSFRDGSQQFHLRSDVVLVENVNSQKVSQSPSTSKLPVKITCPNCLYHGDSRVEEKVGIEGMALIILMALFCFIWAYWGMKCITRTYIHKCGSCSSFLGKCKAA